MVAHNQAISKAGVLQSKAGRTIGHSIFFESECQRRINLVKGHKYKMQFLKVNQ